MNIKKLLLVLLLCVGGVARVSAAAANAVPLFEKSATFAETKGFIGTQKDVADITNLILNFAQNSGKIAVGDVCKQLAKYVKVTTLDMDLSGQELGSAGVTQLVNAIPKTVEKLVLNVRKNKFDGKPSALATALVKHVQLRQLSLDISDNDTNNLFMANEVIYSNISLFLQDLSKLANLLSFSLIVDLNTFKPAKGVEELPNSKKTAYIEDALRAAFLTKATKLTLNSTAVQIGDTFAALTERRRANALEAAAAQINTDHRLAVAAVEARVAAGTLTAEGARAENERLTRDKDAALLAARNEKTTLVAEKEALQQQLVALSRENETAMQGLRLEQQKLQARAEAAEREMNVMRAQGQSEVSKDHVAKQNAEQQVILLQATVREQQEHLDANAKAIKSLQASKDDVERLQQTLTEVQHHPQELAMLRQQMATLGDIIKERDEARCETVALRQSLEQLTQSKEASAQIASLHAELEAARKQVTDIEKIAAENRELNAALAKERDGKMRSLEGADPDKLAALVLGQQKKLEKMRVKIDKLRKSRPKAKFKPRTNLKEHQFGKAIARKLISNKKAQMSSSKAKEKEQERLREDSAKKIQHFFRRKLAAKKASTKSFIVSPGLRERHDNLQRASHEAFEHKAATLHQLMDAYQGAGAPGIDQIFEMLLEQEKVHLLKLEGKETTAAQAKVDKKIAAFHADKQVKSQPVKPASPVVKKTGDDLEDVLAEINASRKKRK